MVHALGHPKDILLVLPFAWCDVTTSGGCLTCLARAMIKSCDHNHELPITPFFHTHTSILRERSQMLTPDPALL